MTKTDRATLELAIEKARAGDAATAEQIDSMLADDSWIGSLPVCCAPARSLAADAGRHRRSGGHACQPTRLGDGQHEAARLLCQMLALGISRFPRGPARGHQGGQEAEGHMTARRAGTQPLIMSARLRVAYRQRLLAALDDE